MKQRLLSLALVGATTLCLSAPALAAPATASATKPNIYFIMTDDVAWLAAGVYHQGLMAGETPNIDRIGREGMKMITATA